MSYIRGFLDALILVKRLMNETNSFRELKERVDYYMELVIDKRLEQLKMELDALV